MRRLLAAIWLGLALLLTSPAAGWAAEADDIAELVRLAHLGTSFDNLSKSLSDIPQAYELDEVAAEAWSLSVEETLDIEAMRAQLATGLRGAFSSEDWTAILGYFRSPIGIAMEDADHATNDMELETRIRQGILIYAAATQTRRAQIDEDLALTATGPMIRVAKVTFQTLLVALMVAKAHGQGPIPWDAIDAQAEALLDTRIDQFIHDYRFAEAYTYRDISEADFETYLTFVRTEAGRHFAEISIFAQAMVMDQFLKKLADTFAAHLRESTV
jgi:hypothetical protein